MTSLEHFVDDTADENWKKLLMQISEGNPGALNILFLLAEENDFTNYCNTLYKHGIVGSKLWKFYKDVHSKSLLSMTDTLNDIQYMSFEQLKEYQVFDFNLVEYLGLEPTQTEPSD